MVIKCLIVNNKCKNKILFKSSWSRHNLKKLKIGIKTSSVTDLEALR